jgi:sugar lactone lactonase YvrE
MSNTKGLLLLLCCLVGFPQISTGYEARTIVPPGPFHGVHGLAFGPDGALYAGDIMGSMIHRVDIESGKHRSEVSSPFGMADDIGFAPHGTPYAGTLVWTSVALGKLYARAPGEKPRLIADNLPSINTVGFAPDGRLYVTQTGGRHKTLWQVDLSGKNPLEKIWDGTMGLNGFTISQDGFLYGPLADLGQVVRFNLENREIKLIADGFQWPTAVEMDSKGRLYVLDFDAGTVTGVNKESGEKTQLAQLESGLDNMAIGPIGSPYVDKLYISSIGGNGIYEIDTRTNALRTVVRGQLTAPGGIAVRETESGTRAYIADMFSLREVDVSTRKVRTITPISGSSAYPTTVGHGEYKSKDVIVTGSWFTGRVQIIDPQNGEVLRDERKFAAPHGVGMLKDGSIIVAEASAQKVTQVMPDGERRTIRDGFGFPSGIAVTEDQTIFVTDPGTGTVSSLDIASRELTLIRDDFLRPEGIAVLSEGRLAVVDSLANTVFELNIVTGEKKPIAINVDVGLAVNPPQPETWIFNGIAVDGHGVLYLPLDTQTSLIALTPSDKLLPVSLESVAR